MSVSPYCRYPQTSLVILLSPIETSGKSTSKVLLSPPQGVRWGDSSLQWQPLPRKGTSLLPHLPLTLMKWGVGVKLAPILQKSCSQQTLWRNGWPDNWGFSGLKTHVFYSSSMDLILQATRKDPTQCFGPFFLQVLEYIKNISEEIKKKFSRNNLFLKETV